MAQQKFKVKIPKGYSPQERVALGLEIIDHIIDRSKAGKDKKDNPFPKYSEGYTKSFDFKLAGKNKNKVDLTLSGEMLNSLEILNHNSGEITIGIPRGDELNNAKAEGNIKGTYGSKKANPSKARDFMGISKDGLQGILDKYPTEKKGKNLDLLQTLLASEASREVADQFFGVERIENDISE